MARTHGLPERKYLPSTLARTISQLLLAPRKVKEPVKSLNQETMESTRWKQATMEKSRWERLCSPARSDMAIRTRGTEENTNIARHWKKLVYSDFVIIESSD
jgi:hypothetical protein